ncbi:MAG: outer membrane protein assembly factor BamD [Terriglobales bacterium]
MKRLIFVSVATVAALSNAGCLLGRHKNTNPLANVHSAQPDKVLFDRAAKDLDARKYTVARLTLQTLINAYPDSEYLARAKMAVADSWYREGGTEGFAQAEAEYKDFITFFPTMNEASEAQLKVAKIHYNQLQKPDRDPTHAVRAEQELRAFMTQYPNSPLRDQARKMLLQVQEVLAEREFRIGRFYYLRDDLRAAQSRLRDVVERYKYFSEGDEALDLLGRSYLQSSQRYSEAGATQKGRVHELMLKNAAQDRQSAITYYSYMVDRYPLSSKVADAKAALARLHAPIPKPTAAAIAFNRQEIASRGEPTRWEKMTAMLRSRPLSELLRADQVGSPSLSAEPISTSLEAQIPTTTGTISASVGTGGAASAPVLLSDVPDSGTASTPTGQASTAIEGNNANDLNALHRNVDGTEADPTKSLTPDELDKLERERILESEVEHNVPLPPSQQKKLKPKKKSLLGHLKP